jgi:methylmalonyl-CoA mutase cobalamin-binding subunit
MTAVVDRPAVKAAPTIVRPYGDTTGDGMVQLSFTLPVPHDARAEGAALLLAAKMGMEPAMVVHAKAMGPAFTFFVVLSTSAPRCSCVPELIQRARVEKADAILVSQVVTQKDAHLHNTRQLADAVRAASWARPGRPLVVVGGPRFDVTAAESLGVDRVFGKGTTPREVASYLAHMIRTGWDR